jgi:hypothetical protein
MGALTNLCSPALIYLVFSITQISIDIFKGANNTAFFKFIVMVIFTTMLNILCSRGLGVISWMLVFIPFMLMSFVTSILLIVFGIDPSSGKLKYNQNSQYINRVKPVDHRRKRGDRHHKRSSNKYDDDFAPIPSSNNYDDDSKPYRSKKNHPPPPNTTTTEKFTQALTR